MKRDKIEILIDEGHEIFNQTTMTESLDMGRKAAQEWLSEVYEPVDNVKIERYLDLVDELIRMLNKFKMLLLRISPTMGGLVRGPSSESYFGLVHL